ncbi:amino acid adenylation domain-containing protein [Corynebacterium meridianum]|uniref:Amino acid adenylation domain-containing protein n=1 Tax=Corynebacterium meridianum TaxID=2765363 RepID=A0A934I4I0_9CORY|nr:amino acid adenylation domain-containing protein [Corynebacterium meridianum]MBI8990041.1 amino acid adenylation domain-containing protein [Corynebacterium meridianum]
MTSTPHTQSHPVPARNRGPAVPVEPVTVDAMIRLAAQRHPDLDAVVAADATLTHAEFDSRVNAFTRTLLAAGVSTGDRVAVVARRSAALPIAAAAVIRAGGVYTPVDPSNPAERIAFILDNSDPVLVLTVGDVELPATELPVLPVPLDPEGDTSAVEPGELTRPVTPEDGVYLIYTSGTTGTPKGVLNVHRGAAAHMQWFVRTLGPVGDLRWMQKAPVGFDVSVAEMITPLAGGGAVVLPAADWWPGDVDGFVDVIRDNRVTVLSMVPSHMRVVAEVLEDFGDSLEALNGLRFLLLGGEAVPTDLAQRCLDEIGCRILGLYGPTEAAMDVTCVEYTADSTPPCPEGTCLLGLPEDNVTVHILDAEGNEVGDDETGELYLAGVQLAAGYVGDEELTARTFVPSPFEGDDGGRMYRTGDLAGWHKGQMYYAGRVDDQVKIRGNRVTLGEVEAALAALDGVRAAAAVADTTGEHPELRGFIVADPGCPDLDTLTAKLRDRVPAYAVPSTITRIDQLPVTANGKLDRRALVRLYHDRS